MSDFKDLPDGYYWAKLLRGEGSEHYIIVEKMGDCFYPTGATAAFSGADLTECIPVGNSPDGKPYEQVFY